jgi:hypothetical protein
MSLRVQETKRYRALPEGLEPIGLSREVAAAYIGVGVTKFDEMVADGRMPKPKRVDGRLVWYRKALDIAFCALPDDDQENPWDRDLRGAAHALSVAGRDR